MNPILSAILPYLLQLLETPAFQSILKSILDDLIKKISAGVPPVTATQQAGGLLASAATLHLTGNPVTDLQSLFANLQPVVAPAVTRTVTPSNPGATPGFTS